MDTKIDERKYCVYMHQNKFDRKRYFGLTCQKPRDRWGNGSTYKNNKHFYNAIQRDGWPNFMHEIIATELIRSEAKQLEQKLIAEFNTTDPAFGYNKTRGGESNLKYNTEAERYSALRKNKNKAQQKLRQDPAFREKELHYSKQYRIANKENLTLAFNNPEKRKQYSTKYWAKPENKEKHRDNHKKSNKKINQEVVQLRLILKTIYEEYPEYFTDEQRSLAFERKNRNYITNSKKKLTEILETVQHKLKETEEEES